MTDGVSIIVPAHNEENGIQSVIASLLQVLERIQENQPGEIIVVNDGSTDQTQEVVNSIEDENVRLISHDTNRGYGAALKTGINASKFSWVLIIDADGTYDHSTIEKLLNHQFIYDMVVGARVGNIREIPLIRRPPKWLLTKLASYFSRRNIPDLNSGLRLMRREIVEKYLNILPDGFSFTTTITLAMISSGYNVKYVTTNYYKRKGKSKIRPIYDTINFFQLIIRTIMYFDPLRVFLPVSFLFIFSSIAVAVSSYIFFDKILDSTTVLLFVTGMQFLGIGMLADMMNRRLDK